MQVIDLTQELLREAQPSSAHAVDTGAAGEVAAPRRSASNLLICLGKSLVEDALLCLSLIQLSLKHRQSQAATRAGGTLCVCVLLHSWLSTQLSLGSSL